MLKTSGVEGVLMFLMCCASASISLPVGSLALWVGWGERLAGGWWRLRSRSGAGSYARQPRHSSTL